MHYQGYPFPRQPYQIQSHSQSIPLSDIMEKNHKLEEVNYRLSSDLERHIKDDWDEVHHNNERLQYISRHIAVLQKIAEELVCSLSALEGMSSRVEGSIDRPQSNTPVESQYEHLVKTIKLIPNCPIQMREQLIADLGAYHCKSMLLYSEI